MEKNVLKLVCVVFVVMGAVASSADYTPIGRQTLTQDQDRLFKAASTGDVATLTALININPEIVHTRHPRDGKTALHVAAMVGKDKAVMVLMNRGAEINARDSYHKTPYYYARIGHWYKIAKDIKWRGGKP